VWRAWENIFEFLGAEGVFGLAGGPEAGPAQEQVREAIEDPDEREKQVVKAQQGRGDPEHHPFRSLDREGLRGEFTKDDVEEGDDGESDGKGDRGDGLGIIDAPATEKRFEPVRHERLPHPAQTQARERDAKLCRGERGIEVLGRFEGELHPPPAGLGEGPELARPDFHQGEFGRDEEAVGDDQGEDDKGF
jgi:hypothetical protein